MQSVPQSQTSQTMEVEQNDDQDQTQNQVDDQDQALESVDSMANKQDSVIEEEDDSTTELEPTTTDATTVFPTTIPTNIPTYNPTITTTNNPTSIRTIFPTIHPIDSKTLIENTYDIQTIYHYHTHHQHPTLYIMIGLFCGLILLSICICMLCIWCLYLWKQKRNNKIGMHEINDNDNALQNKIDTISISTKSSTILNEHHYYNNTLQLTEDVNAITINGDEGEETSATIDDDSDNDSDHTDFDKMYELPIGIKSHKTKKYCVDNDCLDGDNTNLLSSLDDEQNVIPL